MRQLVPTLVFCCSLQIVSAQQPIVSPRADTSNVLSDVLWRIAISSRVPIGFESVDQPLELVFKPSSSEVLVGGDLTEALNAAVSVDERYEWRLIDDMVVVRPKTAWTDATDPLNRQVRDFEVRSWAVLCVLDGLLGLIFDNRFECRARVLGTTGFVSLRVDSGTILHVLNQLTKTAEQVMWVADYRPSSSKSKLRLTVRGPQHVMAWSGTPETRR